MSLIIFGMGYSGRALVRLHRDDLPAPIIGTTRSPENTARLRDLGVEARVFPGTDLRADLARATHVLISAGPEDGRDPVLKHLAGDFAALAPRLTWVGYLSTTGVYGHHGGDWVDEDAPLTPATSRGQARVVTEGQWQALARDHGQVFSRIHVEDIAQTLAASMAAPNPGAIYNVCDDDPAAPEDVIAYAARILNMPLPPATPFEQADMTPMARSFYAESKKVSNARIKAELGIKLKYPTYRAGLDALLAAEKSGAPESD